MGWFRVQGNVLIIEDFPTEDEGLRFNLPVLGATDSALKFYGEDRLKRLLNGIAAQMNAHSSPFLRGESLPKSIPAQKFPPSDFPPPAKLESKAAAPRKRFEREGCPLCGQRNVLSNRHHLAPKVNGKIKEGPTLRICLCCHKAIHDYFTNEELRDVYNTEQSLKEALRRAKEEPK